MSAIGSVVKASGLGSENQESIPLATREFHISLSNEFVTNFLGFDLHVKYNRSHAGLSTSRIFSNSLCFKHRQFVWWL